MGTKTNIGILAYGSLIYDPGREILPLIVERAKIDTPFGVEYARLSQTRGNAPTLVPHRNGKPVNAEILVLEASVPAAAARDMLWRRERHRTGASESYVEGSSPNSVLVGQITSVPPVAILLYTDFPDAGKLVNPNPLELAGRAVESVKKAPPGSDGISYLADAIRCGIETPLTKKYVAEILRITGAFDLSGALIVARSMI